MGNEQKLNRIEFKSFENTQKTNEIDKKKSKALKIDNTFVKDALNINNEFRIMHRMKKLKMDDYLNKKACILAEEFLTKGEFENESLLYNKFEELGMNMKLSDKQLSAEKLMKKWYEEKNDYDYKNPQELDCNNFTQMIWKSSEKFGVGYYHLTEQDKKKLNKNIEDIKEENFEDQTKKEYEFCYIALYYPAGNIPGKYEENVNKSEEYSFFQKDGFLVFEKEIEPDYPEYKEIINHNTIGEYNQNGTNEGNNYNPYDFSS